jgi:hypothetical protein
VVEEGRCWSKWCWWMRTNQTATGLCDSDSGYSGIIFSGHFMRVKMSLGRSIKVPNSVTKWKLCGIIGIESLKILQSIVKAFEGSGSYFLWRNVKPNPSKSELYFKDFQTKPFQWGQLKEFFVTQWCHWLHQVIFIFAYVGAFKVMCENTIRYETVAQGKMFNEKTRGEKWFENLYSWQFH